MDSQHWVSVIFFFWFFFPFQTRTCVSQSVVMWMRPKPCPNLQKIPRVQILLSMLAIMHTSHEHCSQTLVCVVQLIVLLNSVLEIHPQQKNNGVCMCVLVSSRWWEWFRCRGGARENGKSQLCLHSQHTLAHSHLQVNEFKIFLIYSPLHWTHTWTTVPDVLAVSHYGLAEIIDFFLHPGEFQLGFWEYFIRTVRFRSGFRILWQGRAHASLFVEQQVETQTRHWPDF